MKVIVTGASGFIGSWFCRRFNGELDIIALSRKRIRPIYDFRGRVTRADIRRINSLLKLEKRLNLSEEDIILHLAAMSDIKECNERPLDAIETNVLGTANLLELARRNNMKFVFASSCKVYGSQNKATERSPLKGGTIYANSKIIAEKLIESFADNYSLNAVILRFSNVYGAFDRSETRLMPNIIRALKYNRVLQLSNKGKDKRDFIYVKDVISAIEKIVSKIESIKRGDVFNIASSRKEKIIEPVKIAEDLTGRKIKIEFFDVPAKKEPKISIAKAKRILKWKPKYTLRKGIAETLFLEGLLPSKR
ncbi:MAG: NAD-dependent epimerase/dehydratase family protein [Candidatus Diapherotrites archaeon]|nr:NAD-dependent epimerase/dehydratase family protein [Candidatus Diapherotrites archaeon]